MRRSRLSGRPLPHRRSCPESGPCCEPYSWPEAPMARFLAVFMLFISAGAHAAGDAISWEPWSDDVFARAKREHRFVLLDLEAVWCHWCHVMDETTYHDPNVIALIKKHYIPV